jgi:hypothetical protein
MISRCREMMPMPVPFRPELLPALKVSAGIDGNDRAGRVLEMGHASHYREGHITTATLPWGRKLFSVSI